MTDEELLAEAEWMLAYIEREWHGCRPYSRFARSLPLVLNKVVEDAKQKDEAIAQEEKP